MRILVLLLVATLTWWFCTARAVLAASPPSQAAAMLWSLDPTRLRAYADTGDALGPDSTLAVPWNGVEWQSMPNFTWAACGVGRTTRQVIDLAISQWSYAATNQGIPIRLTEVPCSNDDTEAQIRLYEAASTDLPGTPDPDVFGLTLPTDARGLLCGLDVPPPCVAQSARTFLLTDNWEAHRLTYGQAAKTVAHEIGHAIGLGHAHFCNFASVMAQSCEPLFSGLGPDDIQSIDVLVDVVRSDFNLPPIHAQPPTAPPAGGRMVTYPAGWNLVAGPYGTRFAAAGGPLYTLLPNDSDYRALPSAQPAYSGYGYWAIFPQDTSVPLAASGPPYLSAIASPRQWVLVGNPSSTSAMRVVVGSPRVYLYDAQAQQYTLSDTIPVGQAAWVQANRDGLIALAAMSLTRNQIACYLDLGSPASC